MTIPISHTFKTLILAFLFFLGIIINTCFYIEPKDVEEIRVELSNKPLESNRPSDKEINRQYCGTDECKFLFGYNFVEQETQSNKHFISFIQIAQLINRAVVLTNVGGSGISSLNNFPFEFYYNIYKLKKKFPKVKFISQSKFQKWTKERYYKPDIIHVLLESSKSNPNFTIQYNTAYIDKLVKERRIDMFDLKLNDSAIFKQIGIGITAGRNEVEKNKLKNFLSDELKNDAEVMLITQEIIRHPMFEKLTPMPYASHVTKAASKLAEKLKPYIAIHWRMEEGQVELMPQCAESLVTYLKNLSLKSGISNFYLATDYPVSVSATVTIQ
ncbi:proteophosphoglycan 5 [Gigaspora margarita]|uniref:Proteophosphoglycan 5 n=1 Tax=Gigaspora margarita TaxID=4874 RepID=A0A8H4ANE4_GIGMA|nr:proteophosphoglycan 5 [Gigaspora margarita]